MSKQTKTNIVTNLKMYVIDSQTAKDKFDQNNYINVKIESITASLWDYSDAFILVTGDITVSAGNDKHVAFKNYGSFSTCRIKIDDVFIDKANHIYIAIFRYNLIEYSDSYSDTSGSSSW